MWRCWVFLEGGVGCFRKTCWICKDFGLEPWRKMMRRGQLSFLSNQINSNQLKLISFTGDFRKSGFRENHIIIPIQFPYIFFGSPIDAGQPLRANYTSYNMNIILYSDPGSIFRPDPKTKSLHMRNMLWENVHIHVPKSVWTSNFRKTNLEVRWPSTSPFQNNVLSHKDASWRLNMVDIYFVCVHF